MESYSLLTLDLRSSLPFDGVENPPFSGAPLEGSMPAPLAEGGVSDLAIGEGLEEGEEELFLFDEAELVRFDPDEGPRVALELPRPGFYGHSVPRGGREAGTGPSRRELPRGAYAFMQWRPADAGGLARGLEWFAREAWWEGMAMEGPYMLRRLREDGKLATQVLRRLKP